METDLATQSKTEKQKKEPTQNRKRFNIPILLATMTMVILVIGGVYFYLSKQNSSLPMNSSQEFTFTTIQNKKFNIKTTKNHIQIDKLKGKIVFLKVFGWDCQYCQKEIPELIKLRKKFVNAFDTIAIEAQHHSDDFNINHIDKYHINYNIVDGDKQGKFLQYLKYEYKWDGVIPLTIVIDATGRVLAFEVGYKSYSLTTLLQTTLKQLTTVVSSTK